MIFVDFIWIKHCSRIQKGKPDWERQGWNTENNQETWTEKGRTGARSSRSKDQDNNGRKKTTRTGWMWGKCSQGTT